MLDLNPDACRPIANQSKTQSDVCRYTGPFFYSGIENLVSTLSEPEAGRPALYTTGRARVQKIRSPECAIWGLVCDIFGTGYCGFIGFQIMLLARLEGAPMSKAYK